MPLPNTIDSYRREIEVFEQALEDKIGVRLCFATVEEARTARFRLHQARALLRGETRKTYPKDHHLYNKSEFDVLTCLLRDDDDGEWWVYIQRHGREVLAVESLSEVET